MCNVWNGGNGLLKVSVIIPVYNTEKYLADCLDSILSQSLSDIEIICVNDASTDTSLSVMQEYAGKDHRIAIISYDENKGQAYARNVGLMKAQGEYVYFVDSDDLLKQEALSRLYQVASMDRLDLVCFDADVIYDSAEMESKYSCNVSRSFSCLDVISGKEFFILSMEHDDWPNAAWRQFWDRRFLLDNNILFREDASPHEDTLFTYLAVPIARRMRCLAESLYLYRRRVGSVMTGGVTWKRFSGQAVCCTAMAEYCWENVGTNGEEFRLATEKWLDRNIYILRQHWCALLRRGQDPYQVSLNDSKANLFCRMLLTSKYRFLKKKFSAEDLCWMAKHHLIIYGAGAVGRETKVFLQDVSLDWYCVAVSNKEQQDKSLLPGIRILSDLTFMKEEAIILVAALSPHKEVMTAEAKKHGFRNIVIMA